MTKTKIDSVPDKELEIKQLQTVLEKEKNQWKGRKKKLIKANRNKCDQSQANHNIKKL